MNKIREIKARSTSLLEATLNLAAEYKLIEKEKKLKFLLSKLKKDRTVVLVCGEFKRGKSSFINALIEEPGMCPVDIDITTSIATQIHYSESPFGRVHFYKNTGKEPVTINIEEIPNFVTEQKNKENKEEVQFVEIGISKEVLNKNLMIIVDTPGVGSLNIKHSEVTAAYLSTADVLLFVCDATAPLTTAELDFVKRASKYSRNIYFILTKIDMVRGWKQIEDENRKKIAVVLEKPESSFKIFPVSSLNKLDYLETKDEESLEDSKFGALEECLQRDLTGSIAKNSLLTPLMMAKSDVTNIKESLSLQYKTCQLGTQEKRKDIEAKLAQINEQYKAMQKANSRWQMKFIDNSTDTKRKIRKAINDGFSLLEKDLKSKVKDAAFRNNSEAASAYIKNSILDIIRDTDYVLNEEIKDIKQRIAELLGKEIDLALAEISEIEIADVKTSAFEEQRSSGEKVRDLGRSVSSASIAFGAIGKVVTTILGTALSAGGASLIFMVGAAFGIKSLSQEVVKKQENEVLKACIEMLRENKTNCLDAADAQVSRILAQIKEDFYDSIQESMESIERTKSEINKNLNLSASEANTQVHKLQNNIKNLSALEVKLKNTIEEVQML